MDPEDLAAVEAAYDIYRNTGTGGPGWVFQPKGYDAAFELYSPRYKTRREARKAALADLPNLAD